MRKVSWRWPLAGLRHIAFVAVLLMVGLLACSKKHNIVGPGPSPTPTPTPTPSPGAELELQLVSDAFDFPIYLTAPPGDPSRLFVCQKGGLIRIVKDGVLLSTPFLNITSLLSGGGEQGLLSMAFDPNFDGVVNRRFYVSYTDLADDNVIARYEASVTDPDVALSGGEVVFTAPQNDVNLNHNGGMIAFGPDGMLYLGLGDGGGQHDPTGTGQDRTDLMGSILRLDVGGAGFATIPSDNPYYNHATFRGEIWAYGLRNPWRFSFDRANGDLYIADVGQNGYEEVDVAPSSSGLGKGANYGWDVMEAAHCHEPSSGCDQTGKILPTFEYDHSIRCSVTGGYVYRGSAVPALQGTYFYGDYCSERVWSFRHVGGQAIEGKEWTELDTNGAIVSFGEDGRGELYVLTQDGEVFRLAPPPTP